MSVLALRFYSLLMWLGQPLLRRKLARRGEREPGYLQAVEERFGHYAQAAETHASLVWLHAVSLGETRTAALLVKALRAQQPDLRLLLTHGTATGRAEGELLLRASGGQADVQAWLPWDSPAAVARFYEHFKPRAGLLMETEVWPNLVAAAHARQVPLLLVNGRLSGKSLRQALRMSPLSLPAYGALTAVYAQTEADGERFRQLGAPVAGVFGNLKFDAAPDAGQQAQGKSWRHAFAQPVLMFASSREGEEEEFFKALNVLKAGRTAAAHQEEDGAVFPGWFKALVVPRHPQRFDAVQALAQANGLRVSRRSSWLGSPAADEEAQQADVWLGDSLGEMALYYSLSDVALLGGSFAPLGGQNLIEAAACGCPVVMGPHTFNFSEAAALAQEAGAALRVAGMAQALDAAVRLFKDTQARSSAAGAALAFAAGNRGAVMKTVKALAPLL